MGGVGRGEVGSGGVRFGGWKAGAATGEVLVLGKAMGDGGEGGVAGWGHVGVGRVAAATVTVVRGSGRQSRSTKWESRSTKQESRSTRTGIEIQRPVRWILIPQRPDCSHVERELREPGLGDQAAGVGMRHSGDPDVWSFTHDLAAMIERS